MCRSVQSLFNLRFIHHVVLMLGCVPLLNGFFLEPVRTIKPLFSFIYFDSE